MKKLIFELIKFAITVATAWLIFVAHPFGYSTLLIITIGLAMIAFVLLIEAFLADDNAIKEDCTIHRGYQPKASTQKPTQPPKAK